MKIVIRPDGSTYESEEDFQCPRCGEKEDIKVQEVPEHSPLKKKQIKFMIDCRSCWYYGSVDETFVVR